MDHRWSWIDGPVGRTSFNVERHRRWLHARACASGQRSEGQRDPVPRCPGRSSRAGEQSTEGSIITRQRQDETKQWWIHGPGQLIGKGERPGSVSRWYKLKHTTAQDRALIDRRMMTGSARS